MMRKFFILFLVLLFPIVLSVYADEWDDFANIERSWDGQKSITNKEFEDVVNALEKNKNQKEEKQRKKKIKKISGGGNSLHKDMNFDKDVKEIQELKHQKEELLLNLPVDVFLDDTLLEKGYYKITGEKDKETNKIYILFYQSQYLKGKVQANATDDDFDEKMIDFVNITPHNDMFMKLIFGSLDFNAYVYLPYVKQD